MQENTPGSPRTDLRFPYSEDFPALIHEKRTLMFWESLNYLPIWLSGAILELKMAANSTYWKAKLDLLGPGIGGRGEESKEPPV